MKNFGILTVIFLLSLATSVKAQEVGQVRVLIQAVKTASLSSEIAARVKQVSFREGQAFKKGDMLLTFDCQLLNAQHVIARSAVKASKAVLENKQYLAKLNSVGRLEVTLAQTDLEKATGELSAAQYAKDQCVLKAPFAGRLVRRHVDQHETVSPGDPLLDVLDDSALEAALVIPSNWLSWLRIGSPFSIVVDETGQRLKGTIQRFGASIDPVSQTVSAIGDIQGHSTSNRLIAGMSGTAVFDKPDIPVEHKP